MRPVSPSVPLLAAASRRRFLNALAGASAAATAAGSVPGLWMPGVAHAATEPPLLNSNAVRIADWDVPQGHFYTQTTSEDAQPDTGFVVSDQDGVRLWRDYKDLGGPAQLGFPISSRYDSGGITYQAMQA